MSNNNNRHQDPNNNNNNNQHHHHRRGAAIGAGGRLFIRVKKDRNFDFYIEDSPYSVNNRQHADTARTQFSHKVENEDGSGNNTNTGYVSQQQQQNKNVREFMMPQPQLQPIIDFMNAQNGYHRAIIGNLTSNNNNNENQTQNNNDENFLNVANQIQGGQVVFRLVNNNQNQNDDREEEAQQYENQKQNNSNNNNENNNNENNNENRNQNLIPQGTFQCSSVACSQRGDVVLEFNFHKTRASENMETQSMINPHLGDNNNDNTSNNNNSSERKSVRFLSKRQSSQQVTLEQKRYRQQMESNAKGEYFCDVDLSDNEDEENNEDEDNDENINNNHDDANEDILRSRPIRARTSDKNNNASPKSILKSFMKSSKNNNNDDDNGEYLLFEAVTVIPSSSSLKGDSTISRNRFGQTNSRTVYRKVEEEIEDDDDSKLSKNCNKKETILSREDAYNNNNLASFSLDPSSSFPSTFEEMRPELQLELECIDEMMWDPGDETIGRREQEIFRALRTTSSSYNFGNENINNNSKRNNNSDNNFNNKSSFEAYYSKYFKNMQQAEENERNIAFSRGELVMDQDQGLSEEERKRELQHLMRNSGNTKHHRDQRESLTNAVSAGKNSDRLARADDDYDSNAESENDGDYGSSSEDDDNCQVCGDEDVFENDDMDGLPAIGKNSRIGKKRNSNNRQDNNDDEGLEEDDDDDNTASSSTIENEHDDAGGFTNADDDEMDDDVPLNRQQRQRGGNQSTDRRQMLSMQSQFGHLPGFASSALNINNNSNHGSRLNEDEAVANTNNNDDDEFNLDGFENEFEDFDPFNDHDNDPHVFLDREGNAYVRETPW